MNMCQMHDFLSPDEIDLVRSYWTVAPVSQGIENEHIRAVNMASKGWSLLCDLTKTAVSSEVARFQGDSTCVDEVPAVFHDIAARIAGAAGISSEHVFFQYIVVGAGGRVSPHYDAGKPGYVTYKCNVAVSGPANDVVYVDKSEVVVEPGDLYCFEASLYKHWLAAGSEERVLLSYGFIVPYADLGWTEDDPRVRLSHRIWSHFIK